MDLTALVDVAIGLVFVFLGASLFVTIANEYIGQLLRLRARMLTKSLQALINGDGNVDASVKASIEANPALAAFFKGASGEGEALWKGWKGWWKNDRGTYVDPKLMARHLVGGLRTGSTAVSTMAQLATSIDAMADCKLKTQLQALARVSGDKVEDFVGNVEGWVDRSLTMMGETYKKNMQVIGLVIGFVVAATLNIDTIGITSRLYQDKEARTAVSLLASDFVQQTSGEALERCMGLAEAGRRADAGCAGVNGLLDGLRTRNETLGVLPLGWAGGFSRDAFFEALRSPAILGWFLTALATSLGATFWFDLLSKLVNIRHGMKKPVVEGARSEG